jgi:hypothetical protein
MFLMFFISRPSRRRHSCTGKIPTRGQRRSLRRNWVYRHIFSRRKQWQNRKSKIKMWGLPATASRRSPETPPAQRRDFLPSIITPRISSSVTCRVTPGRNPNRRIETVETSSTHNTGVRYTNCDRFPSWSAIGSWCQGQRTRYMWPRSRLPPTRYKGDTMENRTSSSIRGRPVGQTVSFGKVAIPIRRFPSAQSSSYPVDGGGALSFMVLSHYVRPKSERRLKRRDRVVLRSRGKRPQWRGSRQAH